MADNINVSDNLKKLKEITKWFDEQTQVDVEEGLKKVKEAAVLIKESKQRLSEIENEFEEIQAELSDGEDDTQTKTVFTPIGSQETHDTTEDSDPNGLPF